MNNKPTNKFNINELELHMFNRGGKMNEFKVNVYFKETKVTVQDIVSDICIRQLKDVYMAQLI